MLVALFHPEAEIHSALARVEGEGVYRGREGARAWYRNNVSTLGLHVELGEFYTDPAEAFETMGRLTRQVPA